MALGRLIEGSFRSLNNLLEHLHQSFFFYLIMGKDRFVSIGTYLPSAMLIAANFTIMAVYLWVSSGQVQPSPESAKKGPGGRPGDEPPSQLPAITRERELLLPLSLVVTFHALGLVPIYVFNNTPSDVSSPSYLTSRGATGVMDC